MAGTRRTFKILLIDDDPYEHEFVKRALALSSPENFVVTQVADYKQAVGFLCSRPFDLIMLDNRLTHGISAEQTVPIINKVREETPLAILSADTSPHYLSCPSVLDVDYIVDKIDLVKFIRGQANGGEAGTTCSRCEFQGRVACHTFKFPNRVAIA